MSVTGESNANFSVENSIFRGQNKSLAITLENTRIPASTLDLNSAVMLAATA